MSAVGQLVAAGRTSDVYAYGEGSVIKVPRPDVPAHWASMEACFTSAVRGLGVPVPEVRGLAVIEGREGIVFERVDGPSMWHRMVTDPGDIPALTHELADLHRHIQSAGVPPEVPGLVERMSRKIGEVDRLAAPERAEAVRMLRRMPRGAALLHGDLHPCNVLMSAGGPIVIDWFDATVGHPVADVVRSTLLVRPARGAEASSHLPDARRDLLLQLKSAYMEEMSDVLGVSDDMLRTWEALVAASRLAEGADADEAELLSLWLNRGGPEPSPIVQARSAVVAGLDQSS